MPTVSTTRYYRIYRVEERDTGGLRYYAREVLDATGAPLLDGRHAEDEAVERPAGAAEHPRGTIVKIEKSITTTITINPTS